MDEHDEQQWIARAQMGDRKAFAVLVDCYWRRIHRWLYRLTIPRHKAEDLTQEVFFKAWKALPTLRSSLRFRIWLFRIARNCWLDNQPTHQVASGVGELLETIPGRDPEPAEVILAEEQRSRLQWALDQLPISYRASLLLRTQEALSYPEIAEALAITEATARWRVSKARQLLLRELGSFLDKKTP